MSAAEQIATALKMRRVKHGQWRRRCPLHDGASDTSLAVWNTGDGRAGIHDFGGCQVADILATAGLTLADLYDDNWDRKPVRASDGRTHRPGNHGLAPHAANGARETGARRLVGGEVRYRVADEDGRVVAIHVRQDFDDGTKKVWWERPDGTRGLGGRRSSELPLYGVHEIGNPSETVVTEGEPARDALARLGLPSVGTVTGADGVPSDDALGPLLRVPTVYLWPDQDDPGRVHMDAIGGRLVALGHPNVRVVEWPDAPPKDDAADFAAAGGTEADVRRLLAEASPFEPAAAVAADGATAGVVRFLTAREFAAQTPAETEWVVEPWVPVGGTTKIDGQPKRAGKTTLITRMVAAVLTGPPFLGGRVRQGPVILLTEQAGTSFREALGRAGLLARDDLYLAVYRDIASVAWPDVVAQTLALAVKVGAVLIVVDTFPQVSKVRGDDENSSGRALEALEPLQIGADVHRVGVIVSFHDRKGGGEVGESGRGSSAYAGAVDVILHVTRPGGKSRPTVRRIEALSRFEATPDELYVELTAEGYVSLGTEADVVTSQVASTLANVLPASEEEAKPVVARKQGDEVVERGLLDDLADRGVKAARSTVDLELNRWQASGYVGRTGEGRRGSPYRYWLVARPPADFLRPKPSGASEECISEEATIGVESTAPSRGDSSDVADPSEESNPGAADLAKGGPLLSSDAWDEYGEGNDEDDYGEELWTA